MIRKMLTGVLLLLTVCTAPAGASNFDCSVVYDEFDQLMMANFLIDPTQYVQTLNGTLARNEYVLYQVDRFKLRSDRILPGDWNRPHQSEFTWQDDLLLAKRD